MIALKRLAISATVMTLTACAPPAWAAAPLKVVASFSVIGDLAKNVGGDRVAVTTLVGPDGDAHVYEPTPRDAVAMAAADVVLVNGLHFEGFLDRLVKASATKARIAVLTDGVTPLKVDQEAHPHAEEGGVEAGQAEDAVDPHAFQSIANVKIYVANIAKAFCAADAAGCDAYKDNAGRYAGKLDALEAEVKADIAALPEDKRSIITSHDAFGYFEAAYGLAFLAPEGLSTEAEPSAGDVAALIRQVRRDKAAAIFVENITNPRLVERIAAETGVKVGGELFSDALSPPDGPAATYIEMMRHNMRTIGAAVAGS